MRHLAEDFFYKDRQVFSPPYSYVFAGVNAFPYMHPMHAPNSVLC